MDKISCNIVKDLLPLYVDEVVSEETAWTVRGHLEQCESCRKEWETLRENITLPSSPDIQAENSRTLKRFKLAYTYKKIAIFCFSALLTLALVTFAFLACREFIGETIAGHNPYIAPAVQFTHRQETENWERVSFDGEEYMVLDRLFCQKRVVNHADNDRPITLRVRDADGNIVLDSVPIDAGREAVLYMLELKTEYILEMKAEPGVYVLTFT